jgi:hypothetical protein
MTNDHEHTAPAELGTIDGMSRQHVPFFPTSAEQTQAWTTCRIDSLARGTVISLPGVPERSQVITALAVLGIPEAPDRLRVTVRDVLTGGASMVVLAVRDSVLTRTDLHYADAVPAQ